MQFKKSLLLAILGFALCSPTNTIIADYTTSEKIQVSLAHLILLYSNVYLHELGHKYTAKWLTGAKSSISMGVLAGFTHFDEENWKILNKKSKPAILTFLAGPAVGLVGGLAVLSAALLIDRNSFWHTEIKSGGKGLIFMNLFNLIPFNLFGLPSDGYQIWEKYEQIQKGNYDKKEQLEKLIDISAADKFALVKNVAKDPLSITDKDAIAAPAA